MHKTCIRIPPEKEEINVIINNNDKDNNKENNIINNINSIRVPVSC